MTTGRPTRGTWLVAGTLVAVLALLGPWYGYHRDELYFVEAGHHPAWGYPDQPPLVPLLAAGWDSVTGGRLWLFRLVPAVVAGLTVLVADATSARLGGTRSERTATALLMAVCAFAVAMGHLFSTSTFHLWLTAWSVLLLLTALDDGRLRSWVALGLVAGVAMQVQTLPALVLACCLGGLLVAGPRAPLRAPGPWVAAGIAALVALPNLLWQWANGWPQLAVAGQIAAGGSTSSAERWQVVAFQLVIPGPLVAVVLVVGLVRLLRDPRVRGVRWLAVAYLLLLAVTTLTGGKPYYTGALVPALLAAGVPPVLAAARRSPRRRVAAVAVIAVHTAGAALVSLPVAPPGSVPFEVARAANPDGAETVGWDRVVSAVRAVETPSGAVVLTRNYGEAGALDRARRAGADLPPVYSGHNAYGLWGPPPLGTTDVLAVGLPVDDLSAWFRTCRAAGEVRTGVDNEEDGAALVLCSGPREPWDALWPRIRRLG